MSDAAIITDSNSGISVKEGRDLGVAVVPMPVHIDGKIFYEGLDLTQPKFYDALRKGAAVSTSQPSPADVVAVWNRCLKDHREAVYIPMSAGLSGSCQMAALMAREYDGRVQVADNRRISVPQRFAVMDALRMAKEGRSAAEIRQTLEEEGADNCVYITVDTLRYLRKGGRVSGVEAVAGSMLNIKPVMEIRSEKLTAIGKARGMKSARRFMLQRVREDFEGRLKPLADAGRLRVLIAYSQVSRELLDGWRDEVQAAFPTQKEIFSEPLTLSVACHTGPGALAVGAVRV